MTDEQLDPIHLAELGAIITVHEKTIESLEKQIAALAVGFADQGVLIEALVNQLSYASKKVQDEFTDYVEKRRKEILQVMQEASDVLSGTS